MTWVLWRQYRTTALIAGVLLALTIAFLLISGFHILAVAQQLGLATACANRDTDACFQTINLFDNRIISEELVAGLWLALFPLLIGLFVGAPLIAREWEQGTYRLAWTQSVSRSRWLTHRLSILVVIILLISIIPALLASWWSSPQMIISGAWAEYDIRGIVPVAYTLFAFALGTASGTLIRKTLPAMALTLLLFLVVRIAISIWLRPYFLPPLMSPLLDPTQPTPTQMQSSLRIQIQYTNLQGHLISSEEAITPCIRSSESTSQCMHDLGIHYYALYQPADRFWLFQSMEAALYLVVSLALLGLTFWLVRKRLC